MHLALAVAHGAQAAPHLAVGSFSLGVGRAGSIAGSSLFKIDNGDNRRCAEGRMDSKNRRMIANSLTQGGECRLS